MTMTAVPVAAVVAILVLFLSGTHVSISSGVGLIALFGLSIQNAIIIVSKLKQIIETDPNAPVETSVLRAAVAKLNDVLIAALVAAVGLAPAALSTGIGSQSQKPFAIVISCGILPATLLTLILLPVLARYIVRLKKE